MKLTNRQKEYMFLSSMFHIFLAANVFLLFAMTPYASPLDTAKMLYGKDLNPFNWEHEVLMLLDQKDRKEEDQKEYKMEGYTVMYYPRE